MLCKEAAGRVFKFEDAAGYIAVDDTGPMSCLKKLPLDMLELIAGHGGLQTAGRLKQVCLAWSSISMYAVACAWPEAVFAAVLRAPDSFWNSSEAALLSAVLAESNLITPEYADQQLYQGVASIAPSAVTWLLKTFGLSIGDRRRLCQIAAANGRPDLCALMLTVGADDIETITEAFRRASAGGHRAVLEFLASISAANYAEFRAEFRAGGILAFQEAVIHGHADVLEFVATHFGFSREELGVSNHLLQIAAERGHVKVLEFLTSCFKYTVDDACAEMDCAFRSAVTYGHVDVLEFLTARFGLQPFDVRSFIRLAAARGHVKVLEFLVARFGLGLADTRTQHNQAFRDAVRYGRTAVLEFLVTRCKLSAAVALDYYDGEFRIAAGGGSIEALEYLVTVFGTEGVDAELQRLMYDAAAENGHVHVLEFLMTKFGAGAIDKSTQKDLFLAAAGCENAAVFEFLLTHFGSTIVDRKLQKQMFREASKLRCSSVLGFLAKHFGAGAD